MSSLYDEFSYILSDIESLLNGDTDYSGDEIDADGLSFSNDHVLSMIRAEKNKNLDSKLLFAKKIIRELIEESKEYASDYVNTHICVEKEDGRDIYFID